MPALLRLTAALGALIAGLVLLAFPQRRQAAGAVSRAEMLQPTQTAKQTEDALRRHEQQLYEAQAIARVQSWTADLRTGVLTMEPGNDLVLPAGTYPISRLLELAHPDDRARVQAAWEGALEGKPVNGRLLGCINLASHSLKLVPDLARQALDTIAAEIGGLLVYLHTMASLRAEQLRLSKVAATLPAVICTFHRGHRAQTRRGAAAP